MDSSKSGQQAREQEEETKSTVDIEETKEVEISAKDTTSTSTTATETFPIEMSVPPPSPRVLMHRALQLATQCPPSTSAFSVGAILYSPHTNRILSTGYSRELPGNTHAEECALAKYAVYAGENKELAGLDMYSTLMPCSKRLSGLKTCTERIIESGIVKRVFVGLGEDSRFVEKNVGEEMLQAAGIEVVWVKGLEDDIHRVNEKWLVPKQEVKVPERNGLW